MLTDNSSTSSNNNNNNNVDHDVELQTIDYKLSELCNHNHPQESLQNVDSI